MTDLIQIPQYMVHRFRAAQRGSTSVEFALCGLAIMGFLFGIVNLGLLGLTVGALQHAVEQTAREATVMAAYKNPSCPSVSKINTYFSGYATPILNPNNVTLKFYSYTPTNTPPRTLITSTTAPWPWNVGGTTPPGTYIALEAVYTWKPIGFAKFSGVKLSIQTVAFAMGAPTCSTVF